MKNKKILTAIFLGLIVVITINAFADEITFQASADATAVGGTPTNNYGDLEYTRIRNQDSADWGQEYPLYKFDFSPLLVTNYVWVNFVRMRFYVGLGSDVGLHSWDPPTNFCPVTVFNNLEDWDEMTVTYSNRPACETEPIQTLEHFGLFGVDDVFFTYTDMISEGGWLEYYDGSVGTGVKNLVQDWINGDVSNYGITIKGVDYYITNNARYFWLHSKEHSNSAVLPALIVDYNFVPEPMTLGLIGVFSMILLALRR